MGCCSSLEQRNKEKAKPINKTELQPAREKLKKCVETEENIAEDEESKLGGSVEMSPEGKLSSSSVSSSDFPTDTIRDDEDEGIIFYEEFQMVYSPFGGTTNDDIRDDKARVGPAVPPLVLDFKKGNRHELKKAFQNIKEMQSHPRRTFSTSNYDPFLSTSTAYSTEPHTDFSEISVSCSLMTDSSDTTSSSSTSSSSTCTHDSGKTVPGDDDDDDDESLIVSETSENSKLKISLEGSLKKLNNLNQ